MAKLATCPTDRQQMEFFGIGHHRVPGTSRKVTARWTMCTTCGTSQAEDFNGRIVKIRTDKWTRPEIEAIFPTEREKREKRKSK